MAINVQADCPTNPPNLAWYQIPTIPKTCFLYDFQTTRGYSESISYCQTFAADDGSKAYLIEPSTPTLQQGISAYASLLGSGKSILTGGNDISSEGNWRWNSSPGKYYHIQVFPNIFSSIYILYKFNYNIVL